MLNRTFVFRTLQSGKSLLLIPVFLFFSTISFAQKAWTLQECIAYAIANNINIKQSELSTNVSEVNYTQSKLALLPSVNANTGYTYNFGKSINPNTNIYTNQEVQSSNFGANGSLPVFNGFQLMNSLSQSKYEYMASNENLLKLKNDISLNVAAAYLQVLYSKEALKAVNDRVEAATQNRNRTKLMVDAGSMAQGNLLDAESALAVEELAKVNAENQLTSSLITITQLLELKSTDEFVISEPSVELPDQSSLTMSADEIFNTALKTLPEFRAAEWNIKSAEKSLSVSKGARFPRLSLDGGLSSVYSNASRISGEVKSFNDQMSDNFNKYVGLSLAIPIFNGWSTESNIKRSKINLENIKYNDQLTRNQVYKSIVQAHSDAVSGLKKYYASEKASVSNKESLGYAQKKYDVGILSSIEYLNVRNAASKADSDFLQAKYDLIFRLKVLDFYLGKPLAF